MNLFSCLLIIFSVMVQNIDKIPLVTCPVLIIHVSILLLAVSLLLPCTQLKIFDLHPHILFFVPITCLFIYERELTPSQIICFLFEALMN